MPWHTHIICTLSMLTCVLIQFLIQLGICLFAGYVVLHSSITSSRCPFRWIVLYRDCTNSMLLLLMNDDDCSLLSLLCVKAYQNTVCLHRAFTCRQKSIMLTWLQLWRGRAFVWLSWRMYLCSVIKKTWHFWRQSVRWSFLPLQLFFQRSNQCLRNQYD